MSRAPGPKEQALREQRERQARRLGMTPIKVEKGERLPDAIDRVQERQRSRGQPPKPGKRTGRSSKR